MYRNESKAHQETFCAYNISVCVSNKYDSNAYFLTIEYVHKGFSILLGDLRLVTIEAK